jgi:hypothetical protein
MKGTTTRNDKEGNRVAPTFAGTDYEEILPGLYTAKPVEIESSKAGSRRR